MSYNLLDFEIMIMDMCDSINPKTCEDLEYLADSLHQSIEVAIQDYIEDSENLNIDDYNSNY